MQLSPQQLSRIVASLKSSDGSSKGSEKRRFSRFAIHAQVSLYTIEQQKVGRSYTAVIRDISFGGLGLLQGSSTDKGHRFIVRLPSGPRIDLYILCTAAFCRPLADGIFGIGAEFVSMVEKQLASDLDRRKEQEAKRIQNSILE